MPNMNAAQVTREAKRQLKIAGLPAYRVRTRFSRLAEVSPEGRYYGWLVHIFGLDADSIEAVELIMGNMPGLISVRRSPSSGFLSVVVENQ